MLWNRRNFLMLCAASLSSCFPKRLPQNSAVKANEAQTTLPFQRPSLTELQNSKRKVYAHWNFFPPSLDNQPFGSDFYSRNYLQPNGEHKKFIKGGGYLRERPLPEIVKKGENWEIINLAEDQTLAANIGIDAFQVNVGSINSLIKPTGIFPKMLAATLLNQSNFKVFPCLDLASKLRDTSAEDIVAALKLIANNPGMMRSDDGRPYLSAFKAENWAVEQWQQIFQMLKDTGTPFSFFPVYLNLYNATPEQIEISDLICEWSGDRLEALPGLRRKASKLRARRKTWCHPIWPQDFRPKNNWYTEANNSLLFREGWKLAIEVEADAVNLLTWNDYSEGSEIRPSTGIQYGFNDLAAYFIAAYKSGKAPVIKRDCLYYFHRTQWAQSEIKRPQFFELKSSGPAINEIELVAFLTSPGRLTIKTASRETSADMPAGLVSLRAPLDVGTPLFRLERDGRLIEELTSAFTVSDDPIRVDLLYRAGSSNRKPEAAQ